MNAIRQVQALNKKELEHAIPPEASWHADYRDTAYIYIGGLPFDLTEGDIVTIFSQYGEPVHINLARDKETGKSRGFAFLKYEDQRSTDLAVDNLGGSTILGRMLRVDHTRYKRRDDEEEDNNVAKLMGDAAIGGCEEERGDRRRGDADRKELRPMLKEEKELQELIQNHDEEDPMKAFLVEEKKEEVARAIEKYQSEAKSSRRRNHSRERSSRHHHRHRSSDRDRKSRHRSTERSERSRRDRTPERSDRHQRERTPERSDRYQRDRTPEGSRRDRTTERSDKYQRDYTPERSERRRDRTSRSYSPGPRRHGDRDRQDRDRHDRR